MANKPNLPETSSPQFLPRVKEILMVLTGQRRNKITLPALRSDAVTTTPTAAQHNALREDMLANRAALAALIERLDG